MLTRSRNATSQVICDPCRGHKSYRRGRICAARQPRSAAILHSKRCARPSAFVSDQWRPLIRSQSKAMAVLVITQTCISLSPSARAVFSHSTSCTVLCTIRPPSPHRSSPPQPPYRPLSQRPLCGLCGHGGLVFHTATPRYVGCGNNTIENSCRLCFNLALLVYTSPQTRPSQNNTSRTL